MPSGADHKRKPGPGAPTVAAIVPATDSPPGLDRCLTALRASTRAPDEVVVVTEPARSGPAAARNAGAERSEADVLVFCDSDVVVYPDAIARVAEAFASDPDLDAVFGAYDDSPPQPGAVSRYRNLLHHHVHAGSAGPATTFWAGLGAIRRSSFERVGGFDSARFPHPAVEDIELGMRMAAAGMRIRLDPQIRATHLKRWGLTSMVRTDFARRAVPWARLQLEAGRIGGELNLGGRHRIAALASVGAALGVAARRPRVATAAVLALVVAQLPFFALLARRGGPRLASAGVPLHLLHHLTGVAGAATALAVHVAEGGP